MNIKSVNGTSLTSVENKKPIEDYWRQRLQGYQKTPLRIDDGKESRLEKDNQRANLQVKLNQGLMKAINRLSTNNELSVNSIFLGGWALLLSRYSQETDIVFGKRTSSPQGFGNIVPVRVDIEANVEALSWLQKVHQSQQAQIPYESATLSSIQSITDINHKALLFDSLLVLDDYLT